MRICNEPNCGKKHVGNGLCGMHYSRLYRKDHNDSMKLYHKERYKNPEIRKKKIASIIKYISKPEVRNHINEKARWRWNNTDRPKQTKRIWRKNNPRSNRGFTLELQLSMNNVRKRDKNTCQWYKCGLTNKDTSIHVHHIFPRSEYPELEEIEQFMICYCEEHHRFWHKKRWESGRTPRTMTLSQMV